MGAGMKKTIALLASILCTYTALAQSGNPQPPISGNVFNMLFASEPDRSMGFMAMISGLVHDKAIGTLICFPPGATAQQAVMVLGKYMADHPEQLHLSMHDIGVLALYDAFPCKTQ